MQRTLLLLLLAATPALAQAPAPAPQPGPDARKTLRAEPAAGAIRIDGRFDEPAWAAAEVADGFTQANPSPGAPATERTEARVLIGPDAVYVAMRMHDSRPDSIVAPLARRDAGGIYSDRAHVFIDSRNDRRSAFNFTTNPRGVKQDAYIFDDQNEDVSWDAVWEVATTIDSLGWTAEFRIPFSQLRFGHQEGEEPVWGLGLHRDLARRGERSAWTPWKGTDPGFVSRFGLLSGLRGIRSPRRVELLPYTSARLTRAPAQAGNPFYEANEGSAAVGGDVKLGLPLGLTLSATVNPDFGQVEVDPAEVNLTAFETFFQERRPFFTEGSDIFRFGDARAFNQYGFQQYFYSRRVGRAPQLNPLLRGPGYLFVDAPDQTTILGAAKVSGKTPGGWSVGLMDAVTGREEARYLAPDQTERGAPVEPLSNYLVGRVRRDLRGGRSVVGGILTATHRQLSDPEFVPLLHRDAYLAGADFEHSWARRAWTLSGYLAASRVSGSGQALALTQGRPARYFARPDAEHVELDPNRTSLKGRMGQLAVSHQGDWDGSVIYKEASPGFEINDMGFQGRTDYRAVATFLGRRVLRPHGATRMHSYHTFSNLAWNFGGDRITTGVGGGGNVTLKNFWDASASLVHNPETMSDRLTRGGPLARSPARTGLSLSVGSDPRKSLSFRGNTFWAADRAGGYERMLAASADVRPSTALRVRFGPQLFRARISDQYVRAAPDPRATSTYASRYVFAELEQTTLAMETRIDWTFTPNLSLQLFAQPFISAGRYEEIKELRAPGTRDFDVYGSDRGTLCRYETPRGALYAIDPVSARPCPAAPPARNDPAFTLGFPDPDFTFRSLRGNAVLRWEYRPGSALFLVWQQDRASFLPQGSFDFGRDYGALFREPARNVFLVKATYWIGG